MDLKEATKIAKKKAIHWTKHPGFKNITNFSFEIKTKENVAFFIVNFDMTYDNIEQTFGTIIHFHPSGDTIMKEPELKKRDGKPLLKLKEIKINNSGIFNIIERCEQGRCKIYEERIKRNLTITGIRNNSKIEEFIFRIFKELAPEILEKLIKQLNQELNHISAFTTETFSGAVGQIGFRANNKSYVFKIYNNKHVALTEFKIGQEISKDRDLQLVCSKTIFTEHQKEPTHYENYYLILTEDLKYTQGHLVSGLETKLIGLIGHNRYKFEIMHKIYVIALFHSRLKHLLKHEKMKQLNSRKEFFSFNLIEQEIIKEIPGAKKYLKELKHIYHDIVQKHKTFDKTVFSHNDPKWDNFVNGHLIDFGSAHASAPHTDLARILIFEAYYSEFNIDIYISAYIIFRIHLDNSYNHNSDLKSKYHNLYLNTYERIISESLRLSKYKSSIGESQLVRQFIMTAITLSKKIYTKDYEKLIHNIKNQIFERRYSSREIFENMRKSA